MKSKLTYLLMIYCMVAASLIYILVNWPYTPMDAIEDSKKLGRKQIGKGLSISATSQK